VLEQDQLPKGSQDFENPVQTLGDGHRVTQTEPLVDVDEQGGRNKKHGSRSGDKRKRTEDNEKQAAKRTKMVWSQ
jgi:hypothetical protein